MYFCSFYFSPIFLIVHFNGIPDQELVNFIIIVLHLILISNITSLEKIMNSMIVLLYVCEYLRFVVGNYLINSSHELLTHHVSIIVGTMVHVIHILL